VCSGIGESQVRKPADLIFIAECLGYPEYGIGYMAGGQVVDNVTGTLRGGPSTDVASWDEEIPLYEEGYYNPRTGGSRSKIYNIRVSHNRGALCIFWDGHVKLMRTTKGCNWSLAKCGP
jgi:hypothetical protein